MTVALLLALSIFAVAAEKPQVGDSCYILSASERGQWKFYRISDADNGEVALQQAINGGDRKGIAIKGKRVKVETKLPGHTRFQTKLVTACKGGNVIKI